MPFPVYRFRTLTKMKQLLILFSLGLLFFAACKDDDADQMMPRGPFDTYDTDEGIDAPIVACSDAFAQFEYTSLPASFFTNNARILGYSFNGADVGLAIDRSKNLWRVTNEGENWERIPYNLGNGFHYLPFFVNEETVYLIRSRNNGTDYSILRSDDKGDNFQEISLLDVTSVTGLHFDDEDTGLALVNVAPSGETPEFQLWGTANGGMNWAELVLPPDISSPRFLTVEGRLTISTATQLLLRNSDNGTWERRPYPNVVSSKVIFDGGNQGLLNGDDNKVYRTIDAGRTWETDGQEYTYPATIPEYIRADGKALMFASRYRVYGGDALGFIGFIVYESSDSGANWTVRKTDGTCGLYGSSIITESGRLVFPSKDELVLLD